MGDDRKPLQGLRATSIAALQASGVLILYPLSSCWLFQILALTLACQLDQSNLRIL